MKKKCIVCGIELKECGCTGKIDKMSVIFCKDHSESCENCESVDCE